MNFLFEEFSVLAGTKELCTGLSAFCSSGSILAWFHTFQLPSTLFAKTQRFILIPNFKFASSFFVGFWLTNVSLTTQIRAIEEQIHETKQIDLICEKVRLITLISDSR